MDEERALARHCALIGFCLMLTVMAKPATAFMLGLYTLAWTSVTPLRYRWLAVNLQIAGFTLLAFVVHLIVFGQGLTGFYTQLTESMAYAGALQAGLTPKQILVDSGEVFGQVLPRMYEDMSTTVYAMLVLLVVNLAVLFSKRFSQPVFVVGNAVLLFCILGLAWYELLEAGYWVGGHNYGMYTGLAAVSFSIIGCSAVLLALLASFTSPERRAALAPLALLFSCGWLTLAYGFGSGNGLVRQSSGAVVFVMGAVLLAVHWWEGRWRYQLLCWPTALLLLTSTAMILDGAYREPYRLGNSLAQQTERVRFLGNPSELKVNPATANYINGLRQLALDHQWQEGTELLDLTGATPLALNVLNARAIKTMWLAGGYPGSDSAAKQVLTDVMPQQVRQAWLLTAPDGTIKLSESILEVAGLKLKRDWEAVGEVQTGYRNEKQVLWRPRSR